MQVYKKFIFYICKCTANFGLILSGEEEGAGLPNK